jgi:hypothetical protein
VRRIGWAALFLMDHTFRRLAGSAAAARLLELVSYEEPAAPGNGDGRTAAEIPDLGYRAAVPASAPLPAAGPRHIRAWQVQWKPAPRSSGESLGYKSQGGFYLPRTGDGPPRPGILVLPVLHDRLSLASGTLARYLASQGFAALEVRSGASFLDRVRVSEDEHGPTWEEVVAGMIVDGRRGLDWLCSRPEVDARRLGIVGVSHGAIVGPCVLGADPRLQAGVFCMGGADQAMIVARSREPSVRRFRRRFLRARGLASADDLLRLGTAQRSPTEPIRYAPAVDPRAVLLFKTRLDRAVVPEAQDKLWEALGRPRRITLPFGHIGFALAFYYAARRAAAFLWERLS